MKPGIMALKKIHPGVVLAVDNPESIPIQALE
jgi:hypothetical protein